MKENESNEKEAQHFHSEIFTMCRRTTNLSFDGDAETIDGSLGPVSLTKDASSETDASFCISHFNPLDVVTVERPNWNKADVMLFTANDDQQLFFRQIINLVDAFAFTNSSDFYSEEKPPNKKTISK